MNQERAVLCVAVPVHHVLCTWRRLCPWQKHTTCVHMLLLDMSPVGQKLCFCTVQFTVDVLCLSLALKPVPRMCTSLHGCARIHMCTISTDHPVGLMPAEHCIGKMVRSVVASVKSLKRDGMQTRHTVIGKFVVFCWFLQESLITFCVFLALVLQFCNFVLFLLEVSEYTVCVCVSSRSLSLCPAKLCNNLKNIELRGVDHICVYLESI